MFVVTVPATPKEESRTPAAACAGRASTATSRHGTSNETIDLRGDTFLPTYGRGKRRVNRSFASRTHAGEEFDDPIRLCLRHGDAVARLDVRPGVIREPGLHHVRDGERVGPGSH